MKYLVYGIVLYELKNNLLCDSFLVWGLSQADVEFQEKQNIKNIHPDAYNIQVFSNVVKPENIERIKNYLNG